VKKKYDDALALFVLAGAYGRFDISRVSDRSSQTAVFALKTIFLTSVLESTPQGEEFKKLMLATLSDDKKRTEFCIWTKNIGPPQYFPKYMLKHGTPGITGEYSEKYLNPYFDSRTAWKEAINSYLECPQGWDQQESP
jgi:hypothetical protein